MKKILCVLLLSTKVVASEGPKPKLVVSCPASFECTEGELSCKFIQPSDVDKKYFTIPSFPYNYPSGVYTFQKAYWYTKNSLTCEYSQAGKTIGDSAINTYHPEGRGANWRPSTSAPSVCQSPGNPHGCPMAVDR